MSDLIDDLEQQLAAKGIDDPEQQFSNSVMTVPEHCLANVVGGFGQQVGFGQAFDQLIGPGGFKQTIFTQNITVQPPPN